MSLSDKLFFFFFAVASLLTSTSFDFWNLNWTFCKLIIPKSMFAIYFGVIFHFYFLRDVGNILLHGNARSKDLYTSSNVLLYKFMLGPKHIFLFTVCLPIYPSSSNYSWFVFSPINEVLPPFNVILHIYWICKTVCGLRRYLLSTPKYNNVKL